MVNGAERVYVERGGVVEATEVRFADEEELRNAIERILAPLRAPGSTSSARWSMRGWATARGSTS